MVLVLLAIILIYIGFTYNRLVKKEEDVKLKWGDLQNTYQRRADLTPGLVAVVKGSSDYEKQTLEQVATARANALQTATNTAEVNADNYNRQEQAQSEMVNSVNRLIGIIEKYPDLKTTKSFLYLQSQLEGTERRIKVARADFNQSVAEYNKLVRGSPSNTVASIFGFKPKEGFASDAGTNNAPEVKF
ncbi:MAG TPA: LemA family protein [Puia sp.]|nr:LemA family protein [Puia sp.]